MEDSAEMFWHTLGWNSGIPHHAQACHHFSALRYSDPCMRQQLRDHSVCSQRLQILHLPDKFDPLHPHNMPNTRMLQVSPLFLHYIFPESRKCCIMYMSLGLALEVVERDSVCCEDRGSMDLSHHHLLGSYQSRARELSVQHVRH